MSPCITCGQTTSPPHCHRHGCGPWCLPPLEQPRPRDPHAYSFVPGLHGPEDTRPDTPRARLAALGAWQRRHTHSSPYPRPETA